MRIRLALSLAIVFAACACNAENNPTDFSRLPAAAQARISSTLGQDNAEFYVHAAKDGYEANARGLATRFTSGGVEVSGGSARWGLALRGYGYGDALRRTGALAPQASKNRVEYRRGTMTEWYVNGPTGLEQGFTINERPGRAKGQLLTIALQASGNLTAVAEVGDAGLNLNTAAGHVALHYNGLAAYDADGRELHATLRVKGAQLLLQVDDQNTRYPVVVDPVVQLAKLTASDGQSGDGLGVSIAISGNTVVAGTFSNEAYVFVKPPSGWKNMTQSAKLTPSDGTAQDFFGVTVAISGNVIVVGSPGANQNAGAAYVYFKPSGGWRNMTETVKLVASDGMSGDNMAFVAVSGDTVVVGAENATVNGNRFQGAAYVFVKPKGAPGMARPVLTETAKLISSDGTANDAFGGAVSINGDTLAVGAEGADKVNGSSKGEAYVFVKPPSGWTSTTETAALKASDDGGFMGQSVSTNGNVVAARSLGGIGGAIYVFVRPPNGWANMTQTAQLLAQKQGWASGSVALNATGQAIIVGVSQGSGAHKLSGVVYVFLRPVGGWRTTSQYNYKVFSNDGQSGDAFGYSTAISGGVLAVGAYGVEHHGAAYLFERQ